MKKQSLSIKEVQKKLEHYCAYQERSHRQVIDKLKEINIIAIDQIVSDLIQNNYLNENRFAKSFTRGKFRIKSWGKKRIIFELKRHQVSDYNIKNALQEISETDYIETLNKLSKKVWKSSKGNILSKRKIKFISALQYRGWETDLIYDQLNKME